MSVEAFGAEAPVESLNKCVVGRFARPGEVKRDPALVSPQIQITEDKLGALVDSDGRRQSYLSPDFFQRLDDIRAAKGEPRLQRR